MKNIFDEFLKIVYARYQSAKWVFFILCLIFGLMIAYALYMAEEKFQLISIKNELRQNAEREFQLKTRFLHHTIQAVSNTVLAVKNSQIFNHYLENDANLHEKHLAENLFLDLLRDKKIVSQLRYIDVQGTEVIRVERGEEGAESYVIATPNLQKKSHRYYFDAIRNFQQPGVWYSRLDLNIEHSKIQQPIVPTLRVGVPISLSDGTFKGIVIANIFMERILEQLSESYFYHISLVDREGYFLVHQRFEEGKTVDYSWSRYLGNGALLQSHFPEEAEAILSQEQFSSDNLFARNVAKVLPNDDAMVMLFETRQEKIDEYYRRRDSFFLTILGIVFLLSLPIAYLFARIPFVFKKSAMEIEGLLQQQIATIDEFVMLTITNKEGVIMDVTRAFCRLSGYRKEELVGHTHSMLRHPETPDTLYADLWSTVMSGKCWQGEIRDKRKDGAEFWVDVTIRPIYDEKDEFIGYAAYRRDITHQKLIEKQSITDKLSGLYNRRHFDTVFEKEINRAKRESAHLCFMMLDIDRFKRYNDSYGHPKGDDVIRAIGKVMSEHTKRAEDGAFRLGGEEFGILFRSENLDKAVEYAERIRQSVRELEIPHARNEKYEYVTISIGLVYVDQFENNTAESIYEKTDQLLYVAKNNGRNRVESTSL